MTNLATIVRDARADHPGRPAVRDGDHVLSYADLERSASQLASLIRAHGIRPGDRVAVMLPNVPAFPIIFYGALAAGAVVVPMNPLLKGREVAHCLAFAKERVAAYKYPRHVWLVAELPKGPTGKILRREVQPPAGDKA
jgi:long-chain acyl-CoA synthetase